MVNEPPMVTDAAVGVANVKVGVGVAVTVIDVVAVADAYVLSAAFVAVIVTEPALTPVTTPVEESTVATAVLELLYVTAPVPLPADALTVEVAPTLMLLDVEDAVIVWLASVAKYQV